MENQVIQRSVTINAALKRVWDVFTVPEITKQMRGYYRTNWEPGSSFGFAKPDGTLVTNGVLLAFEPMQLIKHSLYESNSENVMAYITYTFQESAGQTILNGQEELVGSLSAAEYDDACAGWEQALNAVKEIAEAT